MPKAPFAVVWEFRIRPERRVAFLEHYVPSGTWARLFSRGSPSTNMRWGAMPNWRAAGVSRLWVPSVDAKTTSG